MQKNLYRRKWEVIKKHKKKSDIKKKKENCPDEILKNYQAEMIIGKSESD